MRAGASTNPRRGSEIASRIASNVLDGLSVVVVRVLLSTEIFVDAVLDVFLLDVAVDFVAVDDDAEGLLDAVGRVARVAVRGGREMEAVSFTGVFGCIWLGHTPPNLNPASSERN